MKLFNLRRRHFCNAESSHANLKMKNLILKVAIILYLSCFVRAAYASSNTNENQQLHVFVTNLTHDKLTFDRVVLVRTGSHYSVTPRSINRGESVKVTVERLVNNDVEGRVIFLDSNGDEVSLYILDQQQFHYGQPIFSVSGNKYYSNLISKTRNPKVGPKYLSYTEANLQILDKIQKTTKTILRLI